MSTATISQVNASDMARISQAAANTLRESTTPASVGKVQGGAASSGVGSAAASENSETSFSETALNEAIERISKAIENVRTEQHIEVNKDIGRSVVKIVNSDTQEVIRQIPSEDAIKIAKNIDKLIGLLLDTRI